MAGSVSKGLVVAGAAVALAAGRGMAQDSPVVDQKWLAANTATKTATFQLTAGLTPFNGALNFNGFRDGGLTLVVPVDWTVVVNFTNHDGMLPHSAQVIADQKPVPNGALDKAGIDRAYTNQVAEGLPPQSKDIMRFTARPAGEYLFLCGVPGHGLAGMWIRLKVSADATAPSLLATPKS
ncbi:MAG: sulfocyanin-like copper-binding protein [Gemmatimonadota bacterium]